MNEKKSFSDRLLLKKINQSSPATFFSIMIEFHYYYLLEENGDTNKNVLDLSIQELKKIPKNEENPDTRQLILDENEVQKLDNIDGYPKLEKV